MNKRISIVLFIVALLLCGVSLFVAWSDKGIVHLANRAFTVPLDRIDSMELYQGAQTIASFKLAGKDSWVVSIPGMEPPQVAADPKVIKELFNFIYKARKTPVDSKAAGSSSRAKPAKMKQFVIHAGNESQTIYLDGFSDDGFMGYFYTGDDLDQKMQVEAQLARVFDRKASDMRSLNLFDPQQGDGPDEITLYTGDSEPPMVIRRKQGQWIIVEPFTWPADPKAVGRLMQLSSMLRATDIAPAGKIPQKAAYIELLKGDKAQKVYLERDEKDFQKAYAYREGIPQRYEISPAYLMSVKSASPENFRLRVLNLLEGDKIAALQIDGAEKGERRFVLQNDVWSAAGINAEPVDSKSVDDTVKLLEYFMISKVVDEEGKNPAEFGLEKPDYILTALDAADAQITRVEVAISPTPPPLTAPDRYFARILGRKQIVELPAMVGVNLARDFLLYKDKHIFNVKPSKILSLEVKTGGKEWAYLSNSPTQFQLIKPETKMLSENPNWEVFKLIRSISKLKCENYISEKNAKKFKLGLDQPLASAILTMRSAKPGHKGVRTVLRIGNKISVPVPGQNGAQHMNEYYYARIDGKNEVFLLDSSFVGKLLTEYK